jgi:hypothetical protein
MNVDMLTDMNLGAMIAQHQQQKHLQHWLLQKEQHRDIFYSIKKTVCVVGEIKILVMKKLY